MASSMPRVDLVVVFQFSTKTSSKQEAREDAQAAETEYSRLLNLLRESGLLVTGRRGERQGQLLILIYCPWSKLATLVNRERHSDFVLGLPTAHLPTRERDFASDPLSPADRLRLIHSYVTSSRPDGGLGITPGSHDWKRVDSVMALHDKEFNETWIHAWTRRQLGFHISGKELLRIKDQFGASVALYFAFLSAYTHSLILPSVVGVLFFFFGQSYSSIYSAIVLLWSVFFVEWWGIRERMLSVRWGTRGSFRVEKRRAAYEIGFPWWKREVRMVASVPIILFFAGVLAAVLTGIFVFEAFVTHLYTGPGHQLISFSPTILFVALVPQVLNLYHSFAVRLTNWENHAHLSTHDASLTIKTFALSAMVAYLGLALSAFLYVPFGEFVMAEVQTLISMFTGAETKSMWEFDISNARDKINPSRLQDQLFAYTVTNQVINTFTEIGLPFILRKADAVKNGKGLNGGKKKRVVFEDEVAGAKEEREFLEQVRAEVGLPEYTLFADYSEMVTQFGYVVLWSTIWPLAPVMSLINNWVEIRSDAFKIASHVRRPIPQRTDTIGPWVKSLGFLTWAGALTNSALVYLFRPLPFEGVKHANVSAPLTTVLETNHTLTANLMGRYQPSSNNGSDLVLANFVNMLVPAALIALSSSHGYLLVRLFVKHVVERAVWKNSKEEKAAEAMDREIKEQYLVSMKIDDERIAETPQFENDGSSTAFWREDEGLDEIRRVLKDA